MKLIEGLMWPDDVGEKWKHSFKHVRSIEWAIAHCTARRMAVQAGGNIGLWPRRLSKSFGWVVTFEPEPISRRCLEANTSEIGNITVRPQALGRDAGRCGIHRKSLGSHRVINGTTSEVMALDTLELSTVDLIALDIEGYERHALEGAEETIKRCSPMIQVELRDHARKYGYSDDDVRSFLGGLGYHEVSRQPGSDVVFSR